MEFLPEKIDQYAVDHTSAASEVLEELHRETWQKVLQPRMLSGHLQGRVLSLFSKMLNPKRILEIGAYTGYSAICMAEGLAEDGMLHTIDINEELASMQDKYFEKARLADKITRHIGNAIHLIPEMNETWDMVFIDADKENYINYYELALPQTRPGGLLIFDNVLWSGKVVEAVNPKDEETVTLVKLNELVQSDSRVENVLLPVRDGLLIARKL